MARRASKEPVHWLVPSRKTPIAYSTQAVSHLIGLFAEQGMTFSEAHAAINYDVEAKAVIQKFIDLGFGDHNMTEFGVRY